MTAPKIVGVITCTAATAAVLICAVRPFGWDNQSDAAFVASLIAGSGFGWLAGFGYRVDETELAIQEPYLVAYAEVEGQRDRLFQLLDAARTDVDDAHSMAVSVGAVEITAELDQILREGSLSLDRQGEALAVDLAEPEGVS